MAALEVSNLLAVLAACFVFSQQKNTPQITLTLASVAAAVYSLLALIHLSNSLLLGLSQEVVARLPGFSNIRAFSHWQTWTLPLIGALPFFHEHLRRIPRYWLWTLAITWWFLFYIAAGRGTALGTIVATLAVCLIYKRTALPWLKVFCIAACAGISLGYLWIEFESMAVISHLHADGGLLNSRSSGRLLLWQETWSMFLANPWLGVGPMHFAYVTESRFGSPHNSLLLMLAETGALTTIPLVLIILAALKNILKPPRIDADNNLSIGIVAACIAAITHSLFSGIQLAPYSQLWLVIIIGTAINIWKQEPSSKQSNRLERVIAVSVGCILVGSVIYTVVDPSLPDPWAEIFGQHYPRFWSHGQF